MSHRRVYPAGGGLTVHGINTSYCERRRKTMRPFSYRCVCVCACVRAQEPLTSADTVQSRVHTELSCSNARIWQTSSGAHVNRLTRTRANTHTTHAHTHLHSDAFMQKPLATRSHAEPSAEYDIRAVGWTEGHTRCRHTRTQRQRRGSNTNECETHLSH